MLGGWFFFVGFWFIVYNIIVIVIETCIPNLSIHKRMDCTTLFIYVALWFLSSIVNFSLVIAYKDALLGVISVSPTLCNKSKPFIITNVMFQQPRYVYIYMFIYIQCFYYPDSLVPAKNSSVQISENVRIGE